MACNCNDCPNLISVSSVTTSGGVTTITVPATATFTGGNRYCLGLFLTVPAGTNGTQVNVTNGTDTWTIYNRIANYWRPCCALRGRTLLKVKYLDDPSHLLKI